MTIMELIEQAKESALSDSTLDRESILALLAIDPASSEGEALRQAAREVASRICRDRAYLWAAIGLDYKACPMNCDYCSFGESWGIVRGESELGREEVIDLVRMHVAGGARWLVLRTTQFYDFEKLMDMAKTIRKAVPGDYEIGVNAGEFDEETALKMVEAGLTFVYHSLRLGEGKDTRFNPEDRLKTMEAVRQSPLKLVSLVEPVGIEHTDEEIADAFLTAMKYGAVVTGAMARVPVEGTPLGCLEALPEKRLAQIVAVTRLAAGIKAPDICVHKASEMAMRWGANVVVIETGAIPRDSCSSIGKVWNGFDYKVAGAWFEAGGYKVHQTEEA